MSALDSIFSGMRIAASALTAERTRTDTIVENLANARTTLPNGGAYRRKVALFEPVLNEALGRQDEIGGVRVSAIVEDRETPFTRVYQKDHPHADEDGFVSYPNVNTVVEMSDLVASMRAYESNLAAQENFVRMAERALQLAR